MSETEVPFDGEAQAPALEEESADTGESDEPDLETPEADFAEQHREVDLDDDDYR
ncbi:hypothetical protein SAMN05421678_115100 [Actinopolymorpha cephalotaxi]|uniref:Uncharacterized protein n=1 Tax=Actinopolymorpha cephalotaxi TaxID=504797 RepID=A0A1I2YYZ6_9ACTN|nr:hypothetical protein [Actinopolymorpha cephalotaxi]NYH81782.1 hypothetical protein [Actinopolymorpha cephalotaxi]SFH30877.1 hypothetical protein SAMN05421678_115100 [Actinopolymorpha cephalotaxi]